MSHNIKLKKELSHKKERGFIKYLFYFFIIIMILSYFGFNINEFMNKDTTQNNLHYIMNILIDIWNNYIKPIYDYLANLIENFITGNIDSILNDNNFLKNIFDNIPDQIVPTIQ